MRKSMLWLAAIALFAVSGCAEKQTKPEPPKAVNVIYMIGDGMSLPQVFATELATGQGLAVQEFPYTGVVDTRSASNNITDSSAAGTALAGGQKTKNGMIGMNADTVPLTTLLDIMADKGKMTGLVVTSYITHATPAAFYANVERRSFYEDIALHLAESDKVNVAMGGGRKHFTQRKDSVNLIERMRNELGWMVYDSLADIDVACKKYAVISHENHLPLMDERGDFLPRGVETALQTLDGTENGFFLMVEGSQIDFACHNNDSASLVQEMLDFDAAVRIAFNYAKEKGNTLLVVVGDHETGGLTMIDPHGHYSDPCFHFSSPSHTCLPVMVFAYGPGAEQFTGWMQNTELKGKILNACGYEHVADSVPTSTAPIQAIKANFDSKPD